MCFPLQAALLACSSPVPGAQNERERSDIVSSIYEKSIINYHLLHPKLQKRYQLDGSHTFSGTGTMSEISGGSFLVRMLLKLGVFFRCFFSERGKDIPFTIQNRTCLLKSQHTGIEWNRTFFFKGKKRFFDAIMIYDEKENRILDFFGKPHLLLSVLTFEASLDGSLTITSGKQWLLIFGKRIPLPKWLTGTSVVCETFDEKRIVSPLKCMCKIQFLALFSFIKERFRRKRENHETKWHSQCALFYRISCSRSTGYFSGRGTRFVIHSIFRAGNFPFLFFVNLRFVLLSLWKTG